MRGLALALTLAASVSILAEPVVGSTGPLVVTRIDDPTPGGCAPGDCSLREAVLAANAGPSPDTIVLGARTYTLSIPPDGTPQDGLDGDLDIFQDVTIRGQGADRTLIDGGNLDRVFNLVTVDNATVRELTISNGSVGTGTIGGGAIANVLSDLTLRRVLLTANDSSDQDGGAVANSGAAAELTIEDSALVGNAVSDAGGGDGGGIANLNGAFLSLRNVTLSDNRANQSGGAISQSAAGIVSLTHVTITDNAAAPDADTPGATGGGGIASTGGTVVLRHTILAGNHDGDTVPSHDPDCLGGFASGGYNLVQAHNSGQCSFFSAPGDRLGVAPGLSDLGNNGGPTPTHALKKGSQARNGVPNAASGCEGTDQRGAPREGRCDIGAYEYVICQGHLVNRVGTSGRDRLRGTPGADGFLGLGNRDRLSGRSGRDGLCGGLGGDTLRGGGGRDRHNGEAGNDLCVGGPGLDAAVSCERQTGIP